MLFNLQKKGLLDRQTSDTVLLKMREENSKLLRTKAIKK